MAETSAYTQAVAITQDYLGPAAERFIRRQITFHLGKEPELLTQDDIPKLAEWMRVAIAILTEDRQMVDDFTSRILQVRAS